MKNIFLLIALISSLLSTAQKKALVGGTLIDGFGNSPIIDSVILIDGESKYQGTPNKSELQEEIINKIKEKTRNLS